MRFVTFAVALVALLVTNDANAFVRVQHRGGLGAFLNEVSSAARRGDMRDA
jgi:hypothetical protein